MVRRATHEERGQLATHVGALLNDWKLLFALRAWELGEGEELRLFIRALPWGWRLAFPTCVINPAAQLFTGWRRRVSFRLVEDPKFAELRTFYRELLAAAPGSALLKYRSTVQQAMALLHYRPDGDRERAIHDLAFARGEAAAGEETLEPIATYVRARDALAGGDTTKLLAALEGRPALPITSYMGLLGSAGVSLIHDDNVDKLRDYAVSCATPVESLLRMKEWSPWLTDAHIDQLSRKVRHAVIDRGLDIPFAKVIKAFLAAPEPLRKRIRDPLLVPLLRHFGNRVAGLLPPPGPITFVMPVNVVHLMSFLLYAVLAAAAPGRCSP
jgi:hypothetical protein